VETFTTSDFWVFFNLRSILIYAMIFEIVLHDLIFYINSSWTPKSSSVDPRLGITALDGSINLWGSISTTLRTTVLV